MNNISVVSSVYNLTNSEKMTKYTVKEGKIPVGYVKLIDKPNGIYVSFIENFNPKKFKGLGKIADQIEVEHCLNRGLSTFEIVSDAGLDSHAYHYKRGKRFGEVTDKTVRKNLLENFGTTNVNKIVENIIKYTREGQPFKTSFLGKIPMYMPQNLIEYYKSLIKKAPLIELRFKL